MNWEEIEQNTPGQLGIPALVEMPTIAERAFVELSREWFAIAKNTPKDQALPRDADLLTLACILLAVEWGKTFSEVANAQMGINRTFAENRRQPSWHDVLPWDLSIIVYLLDITHASPMQMLLANLDHHNSSIRCWMMEIAWFAFPRLNSEMALEKLYKNIADTLGGVDLAIGLASRFYGNTNDFMAAARAFKPKEFEDQYQDRLKIIKENGVPSFQASLWKTEADCRKKIEESVLGFRMPKVTETRAK